VISCKFFLHWHFITTFLNDRRQFNDNDFTTQFLLLRSFKILVGNYEPIMSICGKMFIFNLHNPQMLFML